MRVSLFQFRALQTLLCEFRGSMRYLLLDLCDELAQVRSTNFSSFRLPVEFVRLVAGTVRHEEYDHWKIVGWIESLNDLAYFLDLANQYARERDRLEFASQLLNDCEIRFFEHTYLDDLFPARRPEPDRLLGRLARLCARLAMDITQESLFLVPGLSCRWVREKRRRSWLVAGSLAANLERVELAGSLAVGLEGAYVQAPPSSTHVKKPVQFVISPSDVHLRAGRKLAHVLSVRHGVRWEWQHQEPKYIVPPGPRWPRGLTLGPTLVYDRHGRAKTVRRTASEVASRVARAIAAIEQAWPEGLALLALLTSRIVPLQAHGVVSFSYRHRPGLSFINVFDRTQFDLIDDLIHENSHHQLNLLLRKYLLYRGDDNAEIFYSPWRRSLRPLRGILHATFTFTMGALLFERLATWGYGDPQEWKTCGLRRSDLPRAQFRCLEEIESVRYSLDDLSYAADRGWLPASGRQLVRQLAAAIQHIDRVSACTRKKVARSEYGPALRRHMRDLQNARKTYGPR